MDVERRKRPAPADAGPSRPTAGAGATTPSRRVRRRDVGPVPGSLPDAALGHRTHEENERSTPTSRPFASTKGTSRRRSARWRSRGAPTQCPRSGDPWTRACAPVQQAHGRVYATIQAKGTAVNDSAALEREADVMGGRAARGQDAFGSGASGNPATAVRIAANGDVVQRLIHVREVNDPRLKGLPKKQHAAAAREFLTRRPGPGSHGQPARPHPDPRRRQLLLQRGHPHGRTADHGGGPAQGTCRRRQGRRRPGRAPR
jgi:hypothetical protein